MLNHHRRLGHQLNNHVEFHQAKEYRHQYTGYHPNLHLELLSLQYPILQANLQLKISNLHFLHANSILLHHLSILHHKESDWKHCHQEVWVLFRKAPTKGHLLQQEESSYDEM